MKYFVIPKSLFLTFPITSRTSFPCGSAGKESACNAGDLGSVPGLGRSPGEGKGYPRQYSSLENSMDCIIHGGTKNQTWLSDFHFSLSSPSTRFHTMLHLFDLNFFCIFQVESPCQVCGCKKFFILSRSCLFIIYVQYRPLTNLW